MELTLMVVCTYILNFGAASYLDNENREKRLIQCSTDGYQVIEAKFGREVHKLCLLQKPIGHSRLTNHLSTLYFEPDSDEESHEYPISDVTMAYGFPLEGPSTGYAEGYIGEDHQFYGVLHLHNRTLHADPYGIDDGKFFAAFEDDNIVAPRSRRFHAQKARSVGFFPFGMENRSEVPGVARARICDLLLLADKEFYDKDANSSLNHVVRRMMHAIGQADIIFRNADFNEDGSPDNIGFSVKYILVLTSTETNTRVFGNLQSGQSINGRNYLMKFARLRRLSEVCLGVAFSGHAFQNRTLGLSFTSLGGGLGGAAGGLCDRRAYGRSFNTLAIAHATTEDNNRVPERVSALTLAHEMGHSFGAHHDDNFPNPECRGYLMGSQSSTAETSMNFEFSLCSKRLIAATLSSMSYCLIEEDIPYCGNGIVEEGEACDCGLPSRCIHKDPCCTPRGGGVLAYGEGTLHNEGCSVASTAKCHPSQGLCCTDKCRYADLSKSGIDCKTQNQECVCDQTTSTDCHCGLGGRCLPDATCHAVECARLGLRECPCAKTEPFSDLNMCGICCLLPARPPSVDDVLNRSEQRCVGAHVAAQELITDKSTIPHDWPDPTYKGPNVSINVCNGPYSCNTTHMRAWLPGSVCVVRNSVGVCSPHGICMLDYIVPRSNVYPDIMHVKLKGYKNSLTSLKPVSIIYNSVLLLLCLIK